MSKIIPWNLPEVAGGSVGGYTPEPTPPTPSNYPYDLSNMVLTPELYGRKMIVTGSQPTYKKACVTVCPALTISGVNILDASSVASVTASVQVSTGNVVMQYYNSSGNLTNKTTAISTAVDLDIDISGIMTTLGGSVKDTSTINISDPNNAWNGDGYKAQFEQQNINVLAFALNNQFMSSESRYPVFDNVNTTCTITVTKLTVYNANGVAIQEWTP